MRKYALLALAALAFLGTNLPTSAAEQDDIKFDVTGEVRFRMDYWENATDLNDDVHDSFSAWPYRVRVGVNGMLTEKVLGHIELQDFGTFGNVFPDRGPGVLASDGFGFGDSSGGVQLYQAFLDLNELWGQNTIRIGRQEMPNGTELLLGDGDFYNGVAFDGVRFMRMNDKYDFNAYYFKVIEDNSFFSPGSNDGNLFGANFDWKLQNWGSVGGYWISAQDLGIDAKIDTYGAHWTKMPSADSAFDWNVEYAIQTGDFFDPASPGLAEDLSADIVEGWFGFSFGSSFRNRVRVGVLMASGNEGDDDNEDEAFEPLFGDMHQDGRLGNLDVYTTTNIENINAMWTGTFGGGRHMLGAAFHDFQTAENPFEEFGVSDDLGTEFDVTYDYMPNKVLSFQLGYGQLSGADGLPDYADFDAATLALGGPVTPTDVDTITRFWAQVRARW